jgi:hypothetical protein
MGDHLPREDGLGADVVGDGGEDGGVLGEVNRRSRRPARVWWQAEVGRNVHRVGGRTTVPECQEAPARVEVVPQRRSGPRQRLAVLGQRLRTELAHLLGLREHRAAHVLRHGLEVVLLLGKERIEKARRARVVHLARLAPLEQAAVIEEHVDQLPQHVVESLHQLLANRGVGHGRLELPLGTGRFEGERQAAALAGDAQRGDGLAPILAGAERNNDVVGFGNQLQLRREGATLAGERNRGQGALADDHRVHELHGDVPRVRAGCGRAADGDQPSAARKALRHPMAKLREPPALGLEEPRVRLGPLGECPV